MRAGEVLRSKEPDYGRMMRHPVPPKRRSKAPRPWNLKPPKCPTCRNLLHPAFDHSKCGIGKDKP